MRIECGFFFLSNFIKAKKKVVFVEFSGSVFGSFVWNRLQNSKLGMLNLLKFKGADIYVTGSCNELPYFNSVNKTSYD